MNRDGRRKDQLQGVREDLGESMEEGSWGANWDEEDKKEAEKSQQAEGDGEWKEASEDEGSDMDTDEQGGDTSEEEGEGEAEEQRGEEGEEQ